MVKYQWGKFYFYCYNDPIQFIDPTGHWGGRAGEYDDSKLSRRDQKRIKDITNAWFSANDEDERTEINRAANAIRENAGLERDFDPDEKKMTITEDIEAEDRGGAGIVARTVFQMKRMSILTTRNILRPIHGHDSAESTTEGPEVHITGGWNRL